MALQPWQSEDERYILGELGDEEEARFLMEPHGHLRYKVFCDCVSYFVIGEEEVSGSGSRGCSNIQGFD